MRVYTSHRYNLLLFPGVGDGTKPLDYKTVNEYIAKAFKAIGFTASAKVRAFDCSHRRRATAA
jgi:hypothetical protein